MNDEDRAALAAWKEFRAAEDMLSDATTLDGVAPMNTARRIRAAAFETWTDALTKARLPLDVATLKGGR